MDFRSALIRRERVSKRPTRWGALIQTPDGWHRAGAHRPPSAERVPSIVSQFAGTAGFSSRRAEWLNGFCYDWLLRSLKRTFNPFHRGVVTTYALEGAAAGDRDNRDHKFSALRAARYPIHEILPLFFHHKQRFNCCLRHTQLPAACAHVQADRNAGDHALLMGSSG